LTAKLYRPAMTMTSRGRTYVTVGSHGFYYREAL
jgi:hypothetical protein